MDGLDADRLDASDATSDLDAPTDAADAALPDAPIFGVRCGSAVCRGSDACCFDPKSKTAACSSAQAPCPDGGIQYFCDDREDCAALGRAGTVCCATYTFISAGTATQASATCTTTCSPPPNAIRCKPNSAECDSITIKDAGTSCVAATLEQTTAATIQPAGYFECRPQ